MLAVFLLSNKVWSPQYVVWLAPLVVLARPRLGGLSAVAVGRGGLFLRHLGLPDHRVGDRAGTAVDGISSGLYFAALLARFLTVLLLCALVVRDILHPAGDVVRAAGEDDPAGGVLAGAADRVVLRLRRLPQVAAQPADVSGGIGRFANDGRAGGADHVD